jgi:hypothetical protein
MKFDLMWTSILFAIAAGAAWLCSKLAKVYIPGIDPKSMGLRMIMRDDGSFKITGAGIDIQNTVLLQRRWKMIAMALTCAAILCQSLRFLA